MAHFAQINENNVVMQVIVVHDNELLDSGAEFSPMGQVENEQRGIDFCKSLYGADTRWVQTSYNNKFRKHYAGIDYIYDVALDAFIPPKPSNYPSWVLDPVTVNWTPPIPIPTDTVYRWDEPSVSWVVIPKPFPSWVQQGDPLKWVPPIPFPNDGIPYRWNESSQSWIPVT